MITVPVRTEVTAHSAGLSSLEISLKFQAVEASESLHLIIGEGVIDLNLDFKVSGKRYLIRVYPKVFIIITLT
jgi:hypothetical protein